MKHFKYAGWLLACVALLLPLTAQVSELPVKTIKVEGEFADVLDSIKGAIEGKGINIAHTLPASDMLNRTGDAFGMSENVFVNAETVEFCSARISHQLARANYENILLCPFTISVYVLSSDPQHVRLSYRRPFVMDDDDSRAAVADMVKLIESIIKEATAW
jgi:uncharacterized protein (DUF302 family)